MNTAFLLMAQYEGKAVIPADDVRRDYFSHLTLDQFLRKVGHGDIALPLIRIEASQKCGNDVWVDLPDQAIAIIEAMPRTDKRIFPYTEIAISAAFTQACKVLGIEDLHSTICGTKACRGSLRWAGTFRMWRQCRAIVAGNPCSGIRTCETRATNGQTGNGWRM